MRKICTITARSTSSWVRPVDCDSGREMLSLSLKTVLVHNSVKSLIMETNFQKGGQVHCVPCAKSREKLQEFQKCLCVLLSNAICLKWPECQISFFNFDLLHTVLSSRPYISTKNNKDSDHLCLLCKSHKRARSRTTRHLLSILSFWRPKILNIEDKQKKFERSKGDLVNGPENQATFSTNPIQNENQLQHGHLHFSILKAVCLFLFVALSFRVVIAKSNR